MPDSIDEILRTKVRPALSAAGFTRSGSSAFVFNGDSGNYAAINVQRGRSRGAIRFTFNGGIFSERVAGRPVRGRPNVLDCHHQVRIGRPPTPWSDLWWTLPDGPGGEAKVGDEAARVLVEEMTPYLLRMITDEALRDYWYARWADATASYEEVTYLERLVAVLGPKDLLPDLSAAVEGGGSAHARRQMSQLRADPERR